MKMTHLVVGFLLGAGLVGQGCGAPDPGQEQGMGEGNATESTDVGSTQQAVTVGWTPYTSEEYPPIICDSGSLMNRVQCSGSYCDNIRAYCQPSGGTTGASTWTSYFSEESTNYRYCSSGYWVTGIACQGSHCDNISLQCTQIFGVSTIDCHWTGWISEESGGTLSFGSSYYPRGVQCHGSKCDNKRFYVCRTTA